jgi:hypothetical protein
VDIRFDRALASTLRPSKDEVRLYCTPIVNLFENDGDPIRVDRTKTEYRVRPSGKNTLHYEVFTINHVGAIASGAAEERDVPSFYSFGLSRGAQTGTCYSPRYRSSVVDERLDTYVSFVEPSGADTTPEAETITFNLTCTNRRLAEALRIGDIKVPTDHSPAFVQFRNITVPTTSVSPPVGGDLHWRLISHLSLNYVSLADAQALRGVLELYNFAAQRDPAVRALRTVAPRRPARGASRTGRGTRRRLAAARHEHHDRRARGPLRGRGRSLPVLHPPERIPQPARDAEFIHAAAGARAPEGRSAVVAASHRTGPPVSAADLDRVHRYEFFSLVQRLRRDAPGAAAPGGPGPASAENMRFRPAASMGFSASDVESVERLDATDESRPPHYRVTVNFMGLYGPASPLANHFTEEMIWAGSEQQGGRDFIDLFHHRIISFVYRAWEKYRYGAQFDAAGPDDFTRRLECLIGVGTPGMREATGLDLVPLLGTSGLFAARQRSAVGLEGCCARISTPSRCASSRASSVTRRFRSGSGSGSARAACGSARTPASASASWMLREPALPAKPRRRPSVFFARRSRRIPISRVSSGSCASTCRNRSISTCCCGSRRSRCPRCVLRRRRTCRSAT